MELNILEVLVLMFYS